MPQSYSSIITPSITLNGLGAGQDATSAMINNSTTKYDSLLVFFTVTTTLINSGSALVIYLNNSLDGTNFSNYECYSYSLKPLLPNTLRKYFITLNDTSPYFKIVVQNRTGGALAGSGNILTYIGVNI